MRNFFGFLLGAGLAASTVGTSLAQDSVPVDTGIEACPAFDLIQQGILDVVRGSVSADGSDTEAPVAVEFILDSSGSMAGRVGGEVKSEIARTALNTALRELVGTPTLLGLRAYGFDTSLEHTAEASCPNTQLLTGFVGSDQTGRLADAAAELQPYGYTPIATSLEAAVNDLSALEARERVMVLISDGEETCDGDPVERAAWAVEQGINLSTFVIGFDLEAEQADQMRAIAEAGGGRYLDAPDGRALTETLREVIGVAVNKAERQLPTCDNPVTGGPTPQEAVLLEPGIYTVGELLDGQEYRYYRVATQEGQLGIVRGLLQSYRYVSGDDGDVQSSAALGAMTLRILDSEGNQAAYRQVRARDLPGTAVTAYFADTVGQGFIIGVGDNYDRVAPESLFAIEIVDAPDGEGGDAPAEVEEGGFPVLNGESAGHIGYDDTVDIWSATAAGASTLTISLDEEMRFDVAVYDAQTRRRLARGSDSVDFDFSGDVLIQIRSREPRLDPKFSRYTISLAGQ